MTDVIDDADSPAESKDPPPYLEFGARLKALRDKKGESQDELARALDTTSGAISAYERGLRMPHAVTVVALAKHFDVSTDHLLLGDVVVDHHEHPAFHRFLATDYGRIAIKHGWVEMLRTIRLPAQTQPTVKLYRNLVLMMLSSLEDEELP